MIEHDIDVNALTKEQVLELLPQVTVEMDSIRQQIDAARVKARTTGEYADPDWYQRAQCALRARGRFHQRLQFRLSALKQTQSKGLDGYFVDAARELLPREQFERLLQAASGRSTRDSDS